MSLLASSKEGRSLSGIEITFLGESMFNCSWTCARASAVLALAETRWNILGSLDVILVIARIYTHSIPLPSPTKWDLWTEGDTADVGDISVWSALSSLRLVLASNISSLCCILWSCSRPYRSPVVESTMIHAVLLFVQEVHFGMLPSHLILLLRHLSHAGNLIGEAVTLVISGVISVTHSNKGKFSQSFGRHGVQRMHSRWRWFDQMKFLGRCEFILAG